MVTASGIPQARHSLAKTRNLSKVAKHVHLSINHTASHDVRSLVERNSFYVGKYIFFYDAFFYEVYKFHKQNRGRFFSDHVPSHMFSSNTTDWISITHFPYSALTRLHFAATLFIS